MTEGTTAMVPASPGLPAPVQRSFGVADLLPRRLPVAEIHNFNMDDDRESMIYVNATCGITKPLSDVEGQEIEVQFFHARPIEVKAQGGEVVDAVRLVLVCASGEQYHTSSPSVGLTLDQISRTAAGRNMKAKPVKFRVASARTRAGFKCQVLSPVIEVPKVAPPTSPPKTQADEKSQSKKTA